jgi:hypothetical protein
VWSRRSRGFAASAGASSDKEFCGGDLGVCWLECAPGFAVDGADALTTRMAQPTGEPADPGGRMAFDGTGALVYADTDNHCIRRIDAAGRVTTIAGTTSPGFDGDGGPAVEAALNRPVDLAFAPDGTMYLTDTGNSCVRAVSPDGIIHAVAGRCGDPGFAGDGGPASQARLDRPHGIAIAEDRLYIADTFNQRLRAVDLR